MAPALSSLVAVHSQSQRSPLRRRHAPFPPASGEIAPRLLRLYIDPPGPLQPHHPTPPPTKPLLAAGIEAGGLWPRALAGAPPLAPFFLHLVLAHLRPSQDFQ
jgi:hypothetical protein